jgi:hypothetical protein
MYGKMDYGPFFPQWDKRWCLYTTNPILEFWKSWIDAAEFALDTQGVIGMRLIKIAFGGPAGAAEWAAMVTEKFVAAGAAQSAGVIALASGKGLEAAAELALGPVRQRVRANHRRLSGR